MEDEVTLSLDGKTLNNLRVVDLKLELDKRGLSKSGSKKDLVKRLKQQLEFEKLCEERKSTGDCDLKKELDAATEQNEFVQRYLAQQQKIFAEQKEVKRLVELEETQKRNEEKDSLSPVEEDNQSTEESDTEQEETSDKPEKTSDSLMHKNNGTKVMKIETDKNASLKVEVVKKSVISEKVDQICLSKPNNTDSDNSTQISRKNEQDEKAAENTKKESLVQKDLVEKTESVEERTTEKIISISKNKNIFEFPKNVNEANTSVRSLTSENEMLCEKTKILDLKSKNDKDGCDNSVKLNDEKSTFDIIKDVDKTETKSCKSAINVMTGNAVVADKCDIISEQNADIIHVLEQSESNQSTNFKLNNVESRKPIDISDIPFPPDSNIEKHILEKKGEKDSLPSILCKMETSPSKRGDNIEICTSKTLESPSTAGNSTSFLTKISVVDHNTTEKTMDQNVPYSLSDIQLPESSTNVIEKSEKVVSQKETLSSDLVREEEVNQSNNAKADHSTQSNGVSSLKESKDECLNNNLSTNTSSAVRDKISKENSYKLEKNKSNDMESKSEQVKSKNKSLESKSSLKQCLEKQDSSKSESKSYRKKEPLKKYNSSDSDKDSRSESSSSDESSHSEEDNSRRSSKRKSSPKIIRRRKRDSSSTASQSSESRESSPEKSSSNETRKKQKNSEHSISPEITKTGKNLKHSDVSPNVSEENTTSSKDPPRKKLKINRNNVIIPSQPEDSFDASNSLKSQTVFEKSTKSLDEKSSLEEHCDPESPPPSSGETVEREMGEIIDTYPEIKYEPRKLNFPGRKQNRKSTDDPPLEMSRSKKSKWGKFASSQRSAQTINISTDSLKNWFPDFKLVNEPVSVTELSQEDSPLVKDDKKSNFFLNIENDLEVSQDQKVNLNAAKNSTAEPSLVENTDPNTPVSKIVFVQNLVRPFTLLQLKEFLRQNGNLIEEQFWIDKIKSKCFATYETEEEAIKSRNAINGTRWPASNPKILSAEFSTEEEFELHRSGADVQKVILDSLPQVQDSYESKTSQSAHAADHRKREGEKRKERDRYRMQAPVREWDKDKVLQDSPEREIGKESEGHRLSDKKDRKDTKKRSNEDTPAKLLDDLFQKTKSAPCIYWLPLTEIQAVEREEALRQRKLEREKRQQQREQEDSEHRKRPRADHKSREAESRRSSTRSHSPTSRRR